MFSKLLLTLLIFAPLISQAQLNYKILNTIRIRDPYILADSSSKTYYMYASGSNRSEEGGLGVEVYMSKDLQIWTGPSNPLPTNCRLPKIGCRSMVHYGSKTERHIWSFATNGFR
jgi:hypothetical protein